MAIDFIQLALQHAAQVKKAGDDSIPNVAPRTRREKSAGELALVYRQYGYHAVFCFHDILYILPCRQCRRNQKDAIRNLTSLMTKYSPK